MCAQSIDMRELVMSNQFFMNVSERAVAICKAEQERQIEGLSAVLSANNMVKDRELASELLDPEVLAVLAQDVDSEEVVEVFGDELPMLGEALQMNVSDCVRHRMSHSVDSGGTKLALSYGEKANKALDAHLKRSNKVRTYHGIEDIVLNKDGSLKAACKPKVSKAEKRKALQLKRLARKGSK